MTKKIVQKQKTFEKKESGAKVFYNHLINGIGYMIPIIVAAGIIFAISYLIDTCSGVDPKHLQPGQIFGQVTVGGKIFNYIGRTGLGIAFAVMSCFIAKSIAGNRAIAPGLIGGMMTTTGKFSLMYVILATQFGEDYTGWIVPMTQLAACASGFIGALIAGFGAGYLVKLFAKLMNGMKDNWGIVRDYMLIPIITTFITTMGMFLVNGPLAFINIGINKLLMLMLKVNGLIFLVAFLVAALMCIDMGGPINKAAHFFCLSLVTDPSFQDKDLAWGLMACNIVGIMVPPIAIAISTWLFPKKYTHDERMPSIGNCIIGLCGVTEPAIPYVAKDPIRVISSCVIGAGVGGIMCYGLGGQAIAPEGGTFSLVTMGAICWRAIVSTIAAALVGAICLGILKKNADPTLVKLGKWKGLSIGNGVGSLSIKNIEASRTQLDNEYKVKKAKLISKKADKNKLAKLSKKYEKKRKDLENKYKKYLAKQKAKQIKATKKQNKK